MELEKAIEERRAYRSLDTVTIDDSIIKDIALASSLAPSCFNKQPWRYVFVYEREVLDKLKESLSKGNEWARDASMMIAVCSSSELDCIMKDGRKYYAFGLGMSVGFIMLKATAMGLVAHPIAGYDQKKAKKVLSVPDEIEIMTLIIVGKHSKAPKPYMSEGQIEAEKERPPRMELDEFAFMNSYGRTGAVSSSEGKDYEKENR